MMTGNIEVIVALSLVISVCFVCVAGIVVVAEEDPEDPDVPASYYGEVTVDGSLAEPGTEIAASIDGQVQDSIEVSDDGAFGGPTAEDEKLTVEGQEGDEVDFFVTGADFQWTQADQTVVLEAFDDREIALTVSLADEPTNDGSNDDSGPASPIANITVQSEHPIHTDEEVTLTAAHSMTSEGEIVDYEWIIEGELVGLSETVTTSFDRAGEHEIELLVRSDVGTDDSVSAIVTVEAADEEEQQTDEEPDEEPNDEADDDGLPGFGIAPVGLALALVLYRLRS